jgi:hypothetical protein
MNKKGQNNKPYIRTVDCRGWYRANTLRVAFLKFSVRVSVGIWILLIYNFLVRFEVVTAMTMKKGVFWDVTPCGSYESHTA